MRIKKLIDSFNYAIEGIINSIQTQKNMRIHLVIAIIVLSASLFFDLSKSELLILFISITLVLVLEMINTAIEAVIDMLVDYYHPLARIAKNTAAGAVLIGALNSVLVGYFLFFDNLKPGAEMIIIKIKQSPAYITIITLVIIMLLVVGIKAYFGKGTPLKGGMPSGHSALAFSFATIISLLTVDALIVTLSYLMALLVVHTRLEAKVHSVLETVMGGILGTLVTILIFQIFQ